MLQPSEGLSSPQASTTTTSTVRILNALPPNQNQVSVTHRDKINRDIDARLACDDLKPVTAEDCKVSGMLKSEFVLVHNLRRDHLNSPLVRQLICDGKLTIEEALERSDPFKNKRWYNKHGVNGSTQAQLMGFGSIKLSGVRVGLSPEQVCPVWFTEEHAKLINEGYTYEQISNLSSVLSNGLRPSGTSESIRVLETTFYDGNLSVTPNGRGLR